MDNATFNSLKYGNTIFRNGQKFMVLHIMKDQAGNTVGIGVIQAFDEADATSLTLIGPNFSRTVIEGAGDGTIVLSTRTVQAPE